MPARYVRKRRASRSARNAAVMAARSLYRARIARLFGRRIARERFEVTGATNERAGREADDR